MNYQKIHDTIIERAQNRPVPETYTEKHHIIPRCMNGSDEESNLVRLTPEEHFVIHQLLIKIYPDVYHLVLAVNMLSGGSKYHNGHRANNKLYGWLRRKLYKQIHFDCLNCGKGQTRCLCHNGAKFCNQKCHYEYKISHNRKSLKCKCCDKEFEVSLKKSTKRKFCSRECFDKAVKGKSIIQKTCPICNTNYNFRIAKGARGGNFCSEECRKNSCKVIEHFCKQCGKAYWHTNDPCHLKVFCSQYCGVKYRKLHGNQFRQKAPV